MNSTKTVDKPQSKKSFLRYLQVILFLGLNFLPGISQSWDLCDLKPYGGLEYVHRMLAFEDGYGKGDFNKCLPQANVFLGIQFNSYLGLEAGYLFSQAVTRTSLAIEGNRSFGAIITQFGHITLENKINLNGPQINLVGRLPLGTCAISLIGSLGVSSLSLKATYKPIAYAPSVLSPLENPIAYAPSVLSPSEVMESKRTFSLRKSVPKVMFGVGYQCNDFMEIRALMGYERTKPFKNVVPREICKLKISLKNNALCSVGLIVKF